MSSSIFFILNIILLISLLPNIANSQRLFEDASGESTLYFNSNAYGGVRFNSSSSSINLGYNRVRDHGFDFKNQKSLFYGTDFKINIKDEKGTLLSKGKVNTGFELSGNIGLHSRVDDDRRVVGMIKSHFFRLGLKYEQFDFIDTLNNEDFLLDKKNVWAFNASYSLNFQYRQVQGSGDTAITKIIHFLGISIGSALKNNFEDLKKVELSTTLNSSSNNLQSVNEIKEGRLGLFKKFRRITLESDYGFLPKIFDKRWIGVNTYVRSEIPNSLKHSKLNCGFGFFFPKEKRPTSILGGIAWQLNDLTNRANSEDSLINRSTIFFYAGFTIN